MVYDKLNRYKYYGDDNERKMGMCKEKDAILY
jgi:hypothetical protein